MMKLFSKNFNLSDHNSPTSQTDRQTTCDCNTALCTKVHRAVKTVEDRMGALKMQDMKMKDRNMKDMNMQHTGSSHVAVINSRH